MNRNKKILLSLLIPVIFMLLRPLNFDLEQATVFGIFILVLFWWATGLVNQNIASLVLLSGFILTGSSFGATLSFPASPMFFLILSSYLLTAGIVSSGVAEKISCFFMEKYCKSLYGMVVSAFVINIALLFFIPQPFPRVLIIGEIYRVALEGSNLREEQRQTVYYSIFMAGAVTTLLFLNGDVLANYVAFEMADMKITSIKWMKYMTVPSVIATISVALGFVLVFRKQLQGDFRREVPLQMTAWSNRGKKAAGIMAGVACLWIFEPLHGIAPAYVALGGAGVMLLAGVIKPSDFKKINVNILIFMTAQFAIGKVFLENGITVILKDAILGIIPSESSMFYMAGIVLAVMALHMLLGSVVTVMSIAVPTLLMLTEGVLPPEIPVFLICVSTYFHIFLPYHQVTVMVGFQQKYYDTKLMIRFGWYLTIITFVMALFVYCPWWKLIGVL